MCGTQRDFGINTIIIDIVTASFNATGETDPLLYKRSVITSEFVSGLFNTILENQYSKIDTRGYSFEVFSFGNDDASTLEFNDYSSLDSVERDGLEGIISSLDYIPSGDIMTVAASMMAHKEDLRDNFTLMGRTGSRNSEIAKAIYLSEVHKSFKDMAASPHVKDSGDNQFVPVGDDSTSHTQDYPYNVYSNLFSFEWYGQHIYEFLNDAHIVP